MTKEYAVDRRNAAADTLARAAQDLLDSMPEEAFDGERARAFARAIGAYEEARWIDDMPAWPDVHAWMLRLPESLMFTGIFGGPLPGERAYVTDGAGLVVLTEQPTAATVGRQAFAWARSGRAADNLANATRVDYGAARELSASALAALVEQRGIRFGMATVNGPRLDAWVASVAAAAGDTTIRVSYGTATEPVRFEGTRWTSYVMPLDPDKAAAEGIEPVPAWT